MGKSISHPGIIERIENNTVYVRITQYSACAGCHAKSACTMSDMKEKLIEVKDFTGNYHPGQAVELIGETSMGMKAVLIAFVLPVVLVLMAIIIGTVIGLAETINGLLGIIILALYYAVLYIFRDKMKKHFVFRLKELID